MSTNLRPTQLYAWCPWCEAVTLQAICPELYQRYWCDRCLNYVIHPIHA